MKLQTFFLFPTNEKAFSIIITILRFIYASFLNISHCVVINMQSRKIFLKIIIIKYIFQTFYMPQE